MVSAGAFALWEEAVGPVLIQPGEEISSEVPNSGPSSTYVEVIKKMELVPF